VSAAEGTERARWYLQPGGGVAIILKNGADCEMNIGTVDGERMNRT
jgi:hypothetical protein